MILKGEIQRVEVNEFADKQTGKPVRSIRILVGDKTKVFRCTTPFQFSMSEEKFRAKFGNKKLREHTDEPVTIAVVELSAKNGFMSIRGEIVPGHHTAEDFADLRTKRAGRTSTGIPGLSRVPGLRALFGSTRRNLETKEILVFVTPRIAATAAAREAAPGPVPPLPSVKRLSLAGKP